MKKKLILLITVLVLSGCGDSYYSNVVGIGPMDEISGKTQKSMGNVFDNLSAIFANNSTI